MEALTNREGYAPVTLEIMEHLGEDRLNMLQAAIAAHTNDDTMPSAPRLLDGMVAKHICGNGQDLGELGYATVADALAEIGSSKNAMRALLKGKMGIQRAVDAHHQRAVQAAAAHDRVLLRELGIAGTSAIYIDEPTNLHLVHLATPEHCQYEGVSLVHCLGNVATATAYLLRGALLYSLREDGVEPRVTLEVDAARAAVTQARGINDQPLHEDSREYRALVRSLGPLAEHVASVSPPQLTITDKILPSSGSRELT